MARQRKPKRNRRGALLIVVLSILVLFALVAMTFVVVAGTFNRSAKAATRINISDDEGRQLVERALLELVRGTNNPNSMLFSDDDDSDGQVDEDTVNSTDDDNDGLIDEDPAGKVICSSLLEDLYGDDGVVGTQLSTTAASGSTSFIAVSPMAAALMQRNACTGRILTVTDGPQAGLSSRIAFSGKLPPANTAFSMLIEPFVNDVGQVVTGAGTFPKPFIMNGRPFNGVEGADADESWDAPDRLNSFLGFVPADAPTKAVIPSFADRLLALQDVNGDGVADKVAIDNDNDGVLDSGWIDLDLPIKSTADGRRYKPVVAFLCVDLDGRLHLNAHGNKGQIGTVNANYSTTHPGPLAGDPAPAPSGPRGLGFGPADVNLQGVFGANATKYLALLEARYKATTGDTEPGNGGVDNVWRLNAQGIPNDYATNPAGYASHPDILGGGLVGVDHGGRPSLFNAGITNEFNLSPYQLNLLQPNGKDKPFTASELERILRFNDVDRSTLPRLWDRNSNLSESDFAGLALRRSVTTVSSYIPSVTGPVDIRAELFNQLTTGDDNQKDINVTRLLPIEILLGRRFNVNRPWGNSADNNGNNVVDEPAELATAETIHTDVTAYTPAPTADYFNRVPLGPTTPSMPEVSANQSMGRYLYARQLYTLMLLVSDANFKQATTESIDDTKRRQLTIRRIAQWAINCVDARDPDAIMTPFEYDLNPYNGWDVDGDIATDDASSSNPGDRRVVWGCEFPDLKFSESFATHDRRVRDTDWDNMADGADEDTPAASTAPGMMRLSPEWKATPPDDDKRGDKDLDQYRIPQGSLFLELYCTRPLAAQNPIFPRELYTAGGELDLQRRDNNNAGNNPVWRIAISEPQQGMGIDPNKSTYSPNVLRGTRPDTATFQPPHMSLYNDDYSNPLPEYVDVATERNTSNYLAIERYIWFSTNAPATAGDEYRIFRHRAGATSVAPGEYLVVGPRKKTFFGSRPDGDDNPKDLLAPGRLADAPTLESTQYLSFVGTGTGITYVDGAGTAATYPKPAKWVVVGADAPTSWTNAGNTAPTGIGVNVSEPLPSANYYPEPTEKLHTDSEIPIDAYGDGADAAKTFPDSPLDDDRLLGDLGLLETGKTENFRSAFLQRLANPLAAYHAVTNPYITVDWIPIDLSVYNGEDHTSEEAADEYSVADSAASDEHPGWFGPFDPEDDGSGDVALGTRHIAGANQNLWSPVTAAQTHDPSADVDATTAYLQNTAANTFGFLNSSFGQPIAMGSPGAGDPQNGPFPWLFWPNRPYVSHYELMLVPASSASRLMSEFTLTNTVASPYNTENGMFGHLLNFYQASNTPDQAGNYYRILDFMEVPSRFAGADSWFNNTPSGIAITLKTNNAYFYNAPFHRMSRFRDPGRVNVNTIPGSAVWEAIDNNGNAGPAFANWSVVDASRRGTVDALGRFTNPFRGGAGSRTTPANKPFETLLRPTPASITAGTPIPLLGAPVSNAQYNDPARNAYFKMQGLQRVGNTLGVQSNVFAIWITVAYFEVNNAGVAIRELGQETGEINRHRGFYIFDRSIPMAFERGRNHNVQKGILSRRFIE